MKLLSDARFFEMENELESAQKCAENMSKAHERALKSYRELRDSKNDEIEKLHIEIEALKEDLADRDKTIARLRQAVKYYERKKNGSADDNALLVG